MGVLGPSWGPLRTLCLSVPLTGTKVRKRPMASRSRFLANVCNVSRIFAIFFVAFACFLKFSDVLGCVRMHSEKIEKFQFCFANFDVFWRFSEVFGGFRRFSDVFGCVRMRSDVFGNLRNISKIFGILRTRTYDFRTGLAPKKRQVLLEKCSPRGH